MNKILSVFVLLISFGLNAQPSSDYEYLLNERNNLFNSLGNNEFSDTLSPLRMLELWQEVIHKDNQLLDLIPQLQMRSDSLQNVLENNEVSFQQKLEKLEKENKMLFYGGLALCALLLIFLIIMIVQAFSRRRLRARVNTLFHAQKDRDHYKSELENSLENIKDLTAQKTDLENHILKLKIEHNEIKEQFQSKTEGLDQVLQNTIAELRNKESEYELIHSKNETEILALQKDIEKHILNDKTEALNKSMQEVNTLLTQLEKERNESDEKLLAKDQLADSLRKEIHELKTQLEEKERDHQHTRFTEVSDIIEENSRLKSVIDDLNGVIEEYRMILEQELEFRKDMENLLRDFNKK